MGSIGVVPGAARLHLVDGVSLLRPEDQIFAAMLAGFAGPKIKPGTGERNHRLGLLDVPSRGRGKPWSGGGL